MNWIKQLFGNQKADEPLDGEKDPLQEMRNIRSAGTIDGSHYTEGIEAIKQLKREGKIEQAIHLLLRAVAATEAESKEAGKGWGVAPWYYEQLAVLYRKEKQYAKEVGILERYSEQEKAPGAGPAKLAARLTKARELKAKRGG